MKNKRLVFIILALLMLFSVTGCVKQNTESEAAVVNGEIITLAQYDETLAIYKKMYEAQYGVDVWKTEMEPGVTFLDYLNKNVLENMIFEKTIMQEAAKNKVVISDEDLAAKFTEYKSYFIDEKGQPNEDKYNEFLTNNGMSEEYLKNSLKVDATIQQFIDGYITSLNITDDELKTYYEANKEKFVTVNASHILVKSIEEAQDILAQLYAGADFAELAKEKSIDTSNSANGGDLGYFGKGEMVPAFEEVAFSLEPGAISGVVKTDFGFHIIKVNDKKETFEDNYDAIVSDYKNSKYNEKVKELETNATVERILKFK